MKRTAFIFSLLLMILTTLVQAQITAVPSLMNFQGRLANPSGNPVPDGNYSIRFSLHSAASGGTEKWFQVMNPVLVKNGTFSVLLGNGNPITADILNGDTFLQIKVGNDAPLAPRQRLASVAYALKASTVPDGAITAAKIANGTITADKLALGVGFALPYSGIINSSTDAFRVTNAGSGIAVAGFSEAGLGIIGVSVSNIGGYFQSQTSNGVHSDSVSGIGVFGNSTTGAGVYGTTQSGWTGVFGTGSQNGVIGLVNSNANGVAGENQGAGPGVYGRSATGVGIFGSSGTGWAGWFEGSVYMNGTMRAKIIEVVGGSDVAEPYNVASAGAVKPIAGMVVCIDSRKVGQMRVASRIYDKTVAGIISGANGINPGITLRQTGTVADGELPVASIGRVWCWCDADANGAIEAGDMLTTSDTPGHAMKVADHNQANGSVIGKAMSELKSGKGLVLVLVSLK